MECELGSRGDDRLSARQIRAATMAAGPALLLLPPAPTFRIDLVPIGVIMTANLMIALYTLPVGGTLFVAAKLAKAGIGEITKALWPRLAAAIAAPD